MANHLLINMFEREAQNQKNKYEDKRAQLKKLRQQRDETIAKLEKAKQIWDQKTKENDKKIQIRENQLKSKQDSGITLKNTIVELKRTLDDVSNSVNKQHEKRESTLKDIQHMQKEQK